MRILTGIIVVVHTLVAMARCQEIPLSCTDILKRQLADISGIFQCKPTYDLQERSATCKGTTGYIDYNYITLTFKIQEELPATEDAQAFCLGLVNASVEIENTEDYSWFIVVQYSYNFNPSLTVGVLTTEHHPDRSCNISMLSDLLHLMIFDDYTPWRSKYWNFSSYFFGAKLNWFQGLSFSNKHDGIQLTWLETLQNTSLRLLNITGYNPQKKGTVLFKDMPALRTLIIKYMDIKELHPDTFIGVPDLEDLILAGTDITAVPAILERIPKLRTLDMSQPSEDERYFTLRKEVLSPLKHLEFLNLNYNNISTISGKLPVLPNLKKLYLSSCQISKIEEGDFVNVPSVEELTLAENLLTSFKENTFLPLKRLKMLDLSQNKLKVWPVLHGNTLQVLNLSQNSLSYIYNLGNFRCRVQFLNISLNKISDWNDSNVFLLQKYFVDHVNDQENINISSKSVFSDSNSFDSNTSKLQMNNSKSFEFQSKAMVQNLSDTSFLEGQSLGKLKLNSENSRKVLTRECNETKDDNSDSWVKRIDLSKNLISSMSEAMVQSLTGIEVIDLGGNHFDCIDCRMIPFQKWLNTTSTIVMNLGTEDPLLCSSPIGQKDQPVNTVQYDEEPCLEKHQSLWILLGVPIGASTLLFGTSALVLYSYRSPIAYMLHLYKIRRRAANFSETVFNRYAFDAFICYSSNDRRFVMTRLAPLLEKGKERYILCLHERDFPLGSHIVSNIVGSIQHSRKTIIVLSEHFIRSKWCNWEFEMANHKMFNDDEHFLILIQLEKVLRHKLPRHLQYLMDTRTYLEWPPQCSREEKLVCQRLREALGPSIFQITSERAPLLSDVMEEY